MTNDEYYAKLRSHGFTTHSVTSASLPRTLILQGRDNYLATIAHPDDLTPEQRAVHMAQFVKTNAL